MPLVKPLTKVGNSKMIVIPASWLKYHEEETGRPIDELLMELNDGIILRIREKRRKKKVA